MKAVAYVRVSTEDQAREGVSLDAQTARIKAYCAMAGLELVAIVREEGVSAAKPLKNRPAGRELLAILSEGQAQHVVALKLDRLFRDTVDALQVVQQWEQSKIAMHLVDLGGVTLRTDTAMGKMFLTLGAAFAELERNLISERTRAALQHKKACGQRLGAKPYNDQRGLDRLRELAGLGLNHRDIAQRLNNEGILAQRGGPWYHGTVSRVLARLTIPG